MLLREDDHFNIGPFLIDAVEKGDSHAVGRLLSIAFGREGERTDEDVAAESPSARVRSRLRKFFGAQANIPHPSSDVRLSDSVAAPREHHAGSVQKKEETRRRTKFPDDEEGDASTARRRTAVALAHTTARGWSALHMAAHRGLAADAVSFRHLLQACTSVAQVKARIGGHRPTTQGRRGTAPAAPGVQGEAAASAAECSTRNNSTIGDDFDYMQALKDLGENWVQVGHFTSTGYLICLPWSPSPHIGTTDSVGWAPLHLAVRMGHTAIVEMLLQEAHPFMSGPAADGQTFRKDVVRDLVGEVVHDGSKRNAFHIAAQYGRLECMQMLARAACGNGSLSARDVAGYTPLHYACAISWCYEGASIVELLVRGVYSEAYGRASLDCADVGAVTTRSGFTALHLAAGMGSSESVNHVLRALCELGLDANAVCKAGYTALHCAAMCGQEALFDAFASPSYSWEARNARVAADVNAPWRGGRSRGASAGPQGAHLVPGPSEAAKHRTRKQRRSVVDGGSIGGADAVVDYARAAEGATVLHVAIAKGHTAVAQKILLAYENRVDLLARTLHDGATALHISAARAAGPRGGGGDVDMLVAACRKSVGAYRDWKSSWSARERWIGKFRPAWPGLENSPAKDLSLQRLLNTSDARGLTPLHVAAMAGHHEFVARLLAHRLDEESGEQVLETDRTTNSRLGSSATSCADLAPSRDGAALHLACYHGRTECVRLLVKALCEGRGRRRAGKRGMHAKCTKRLKNLCTTAVSQKREALRRDPTKKHRAAAVSAAGPIHSTRRCAPVDMANSAGYTPLHISAMRGHAACIKVLLDSEAADANAEVELRQGRATALHLATEHGHFECARALLCRRRKAFLHARRVAESVVSRFSFCGRRRQKSGGVVGMPAGVADVNRQYGCHERTALHIAAAKGDAKCVQALLDASADISLADRRGFTALHLAASGGRRRAKVGRESQGRHEVARRFESCVKLLLEADEVRRRRCWFFSRKREEGEVSLVDSRTKHGRSALHLAARSGNTAVVEALCGAGADAAPTCYQKGVYGHTPLKEADAGGHAECVAALAGRMAQLAGDQS